ncbi:MAG: hypothetical protein KGL16_03400 [Acidobacteriota bacterium]|nr:hypothetical protein [Acidobacteriota bacterium]
MIYAVGILAVMCLAETVLLWRVARSLGALDRFEDRLAHFSGALTLLTETTEQGFRTLAIEIARPERMVATGTSRIATRRVARAARQGRSPLDIAAQERMSEGEVRLRLHLSDTDFSGSRSAYLAKEA